MGTSTGTAGLVPQCGWWMHACDSRRCGCYCSIGGQQTALAMTVDPTAASCLARAAPATLSPQNLRTWHFVIRAGRKHSLKVVPATLDVVVCAHVQVGGRALGEVCNAYPERLLRCLVLVSAPVTCMATY